MNHVTMFPQPCQDGRVRFKITTSLLDATFVRVGRWGVNVPIQAKYSDLSTEGLESVELTIDLVDGTLAPIAVTAVATPGHAVDGTSLRDIPVHELATAAIGEFLLRCVDDEEGAFEPMEPLEFDAEAIRSAGPTDESLRVVADIYEIARLMGDPPARQVEKTLNMPRTTASKWIRRARERGILEVDPVRPDLAAPTKR